MGKDPAFPLYAGDFEMDTASWSVWEVGAYFRLLLYEWVNGSIPSDIEEIARIVREPLPEIEGRFTKKAQKIHAKFTRNSQRILTKFTSNGNGHLINNRMEIIRAEKQRFLDSQREKGILSGKARANRGSTVVQPVLEPEVNLSSSSSSSTSKKTKEKEIVSKLSFGEGQLVKLTEQEFNKLEDKYGLDRTQEIIQIIDAKIASKGENKWRKDHASDYATILYWDRQGWLEKKQEGLYL